MKKELSQLIRKVANRIYPESRIANFPQSNITIEQRGIKKIGIAKSPHEGFLREIRIRCIGAEYNIVKEQIVDENKKWIADSIAMCIKENNLIEFNTDEETLTTTGYLYVATNKFIK